MKKLDKPRLDYGTSSNTVTIRPDMVKSRSVSKSPNTSYQNMNFQNRRTLNSSLTVSNLNSNLQTVNNSNIFKNGGERITFA
jgi:hypothetical protein